MKPLPETFPIRFGRDMPNTIKDVARLAAVSVTTAHRGLTGKGELSEEKRQRVLAAAKQLNFVPSSAARALVSGRTKTIGMIVTDNASPVYAGIVRGVEEVANEAGFGLLLCNSGDSQDRALACIELFRSKQVDGLLLTPVQSDQRDIEQLRESGIPYVLLLRHFDDVACDYVITDNEIAGQRATAHLIERGYERIAHIAGPEPVSSAQGRLRGYRRALDDAGITFNPALVHHALFTVQGGHSAALDLLGQANRPSALFAANDLQAIGVLQAARELGIRIPEELALVGGDNIELAEFLEVPLTTFHQPAREIGSLGARILLDRLTGADREPQRRVLIPELIVRKSSGGSL
jgi:LacI family transcriptional regulator